MFVVSSVDVPLFEKTLPLAMLLKVALLLDVGL